MSVCIHVCIFVCVCVCVGYLVWCHHIYWSENEIKVPDPFNNFRSGCTNFSIIENVQLLLHVFSCLHALVCMNKLCYTALWQSALLQIKSLVCSFSFLSHSAPPRYLHLMVESRHTQHALRLQHIITVWIIGDYS